MAEDLKRSVEDLQSPVCDTCQLEMKWYRSIRVAKQPTTIAHYFQCPNCGRITEERATLHGKEPGGERGKLSLPLGGFGHAA